VDSRIFRIDIVPNVRFDSDVRWHGTASPVSKKGDYHSWPASFLIKDLTTSSQAKKIIPKSFSGDEISEKRSEKQSEEISEIKFGNYTTNTFSHVMRSRRSAGRYAQSEFFMESGDFLKIMERLSPSPKIGNYSSFFAKFLN
jgi:hypothetical protein